jgi:hypothetical protein
MFSDSDSQRTLKVPGAQKALPPPPRISSTAFCTPGCMVLPDTMVKPRVYVETTIPSFYYELLGEDDYETDQE